MVELVAKAATVTPLSVVLNNLSSLLVLALIVAVHELGHFLGARLQGIKVKNFSIGRSNRSWTGKPSASPWPLPKSSRIQAHSLLALPLPGFGPRLLSFTSPTDEVEYTIRAIPAGGFVSFPQHYEVDEETGETPRADVCCMNKVQS